MDRRSTNEIGYTHFGGDVTAQVESSAGVRLSGGSSVAGTGGIVESVGDDTNISLTVRAQGAGAVILGNSSQTVRIGNSTAGVSFLRPELIQFTIPAMSTVGAAGNPDESTTVAIAGATTNGFYIVQQRVPYNSTVTEGVYVTARCSTAGQVRLTFFNHSGSSISGSTASAYLLQFRQ